MQAPEKLVQPVGAGLAICKALCGLKVGSEVRFLSLGHEQSHRSLERSYPLLRQVEHLSGEGYFRDLMDAHLLHHNDGANELVGQIHDRMPVIMPSDAYDR